MRHSVRLTGEVSSSVVRSRILLGDETADEIQFQRRGNELHPSKTGLE